MKAIVIRENDWEDIGTEIEVLGFISVTGAPWAVYRLDDGLVQSLPAWAIQMQPAVEE